MKHRIVENRIQTIMNILTDLNMMKKNTETWHHNFIRFGCTTHPPQEGSHLVYHVELNRYHFWRPTKQDIKDLVILDINNYQYKPLGTLKLRSFIYYPNGLPYIVAIDDVSFMRSIYTSFATQPEHIAELSKLYGTKLYETIQKEVDGERERWIKGLEGEVHNQVILF